MDDLMPTAASIRAAAPRPVALVPLFGRRVRPRRRNGTEGGQALVEFALVIPILMLVLVGIIKGGILFNNYLQLTDATRSSARQLAIERGQPTPCTDAAQELITAISGGLNPNSVVITMTENPEAPTDPAGAIYTWQNGAGSNNVSNANNVSDCGFTLESGSAITVTATYPCDLGIMGVNFISPCNLKASASERVE
jgi:Flp pilus assembly protein TadG